MWYTDNSNFLNYQQKKSKSVKSALNYVFICSNVNVGMSC